MKPIISRITRISVMPEGEPVFSEMVTHIEIEDEAAGEFVKIRQQSGSTDADGQAVLIEPDEWPSIRTAVESMLADIAKHDREGK